MIVGVVRLHRQEGAGADMEGQRFASDPGYGDRLQQRGREMQRRGGGGDGAVLFREHRLIVAAVGLVCRTLARNIGWQRHAAREFEQQLVRLVPRKGEAEARSAEYTSEIQPIMRT